MSSPGYQKTNRLFSPAGFFLLVALVLGGLYSVFVPYGAGFDEEQHIVRIYDISGFSFIPRMKDFVTLNDFFDLSYQRRLVQTPAFDMYTRASLSRRISRQDDDYRYGFKMRSFYSPGGYMAQAITAGILWRVLNFPILPSIMLQRFAGLLIYILGCYLAIRIIPFGKWALAVLALSPMALFQASTLNADGFTNAVSFLFTAVVLSAYVSAEPGISPRTTIFLVGCSLLLGFAKPGTIVLLPLLLILGKKRFQSASWRIALMIAVLLSIIIHVGWLVMVAPGSTLGEGEIHNVSHQLNVILADPVEFLSIFLQGFYRSLIPFYLDWVAAYGYWAGIVPPPVFWFFTLGLAFAMLAEPRFPAVPPWVRYGLAGLFLLSSALILGMYLASEYVPGDASALGRQGRYFIPFTPLFILSLSGLFAIPENTHKIFRFAAIPSLLIALGFYSFGAYTTYYTYCGYPAYSGGKCVLPVYKNLDKQDAIAVRINSDLVLSQTFVNHCSEMESVQVLIMSVPMDQTGTLIYSLLDEQGRLIASQIISITRIQADTYLDLSLDGVRGTKGTQYEIRLESSDLAAPAGVEVAVSPGELYDGNLSIADRDRNGSLVIHYVCENP